MIKLTPAAENHLNILLASDNKKVKTHISKNNWKTNWYLLSSSPAPGMKSISCDFVLIIMTQSSSIGLQYLLRERSSQRTYKNNFQSLGHNVCSVGPVSCREKQYPQNICSEPRNHLLKRIYAPYSILSTIDLEFQTKFLFSQWNSNLRNEFQISSFHGPKVRRARKERDLRLRSCPQSSLA